MRVRKLMPRATKELEDQLIKLHVRHASGLVFPGQPLHVTAVILLLKRTADTPAVKKRLQQLFAERNLDLELKTWKEIRPFYNQVHRMLGIIFVFMFCLLATLMAFTIYNTQSAGIIERTTNEAKRLVAEAEARLTKDVAAARERIVRDSDSLARLAAERILGISL